VERRASSGRNVLRATANGAQSRVASLPQDFSGVFGAQSTHPSACSTPSQLACFVESLAGLSISENNSHWASAISGTDLCTFVSGVLSHALGAILGGNAYCRMATKTSMCPFGIALFKIEGEGETVRQRRGSTDCSTVRSGMKYEWPPRFGKASQAFRLVTGAGLAVLLWWALGDLYPAQ